MTGNLTYAASRARVEDLHRSAARHRAAIAAARPAHAPTTGVAEAVGIRLATGSDRPALERLAALDSAAPLTGHVLIAEVNGEPQAAIDTATGATTADPFRPTAQAVGLLRTRAAQMHQRPAIGQRLPLLKRVAYRVA